ncbi:MAG TPA: hypothetical protein VIU10_04265, partial [Candidatus Udaeobacter sp.]
MPEIIRVAHPFDVQSIFIVAFQCNKNLPAAKQANFLPANGDLANMLESAATLSSHGGSFSREFHLAVTSRDDYCLSRQDFTPQQFHGQ